MSVSVSVPVSGSVSGSVSVSVCVSVCVSVYVCVDVDVAMVRHTHTHTQALTRAPPHKLMTEEVCSRLCLRSRCTLAPSCVRSAPGAVEERCYITDGRARLTLADGSRGEVVIKKGDWVTFKKVRVRVCVCVCVCV